MTLAPAQVQAAASATSAPRAAAGFVKHRVVAGDTLESLGARYLLVPAAWRDLQAINQVADPERLKRGSVILLPKAMLRPPGTTLARVEFVQGQTTSRSPSETAGAAAAPLSAGDTLTEGMQIQVPKDGYLRLRLADGSEVRVLAESDVALKRLRAKRPTGPFESIIDVRKGKVESEVTKQPKGRVFEIHAPGAIASVRGTRFDVSVGGDGQVATGVTEGVVALQPRTSQNKLRRGANVTAGQGAVIGRDGMLGKSRALPAAPDLSALPEVYEDANLLTFELNGTSAAGTSNSGGYEVRVARDVDLREVLRNGVFQDQRVQFAALDDGRYTLGVRARDAEGLAGAEASRAIQVNAHPLPPLYQSPAPGARVSGQLGVLVCSGVAGGASTHLQVSSRADFSQPEIDQPALSDCRFSIAALKSGSYFWRVASVATVADGSLKHGPFAPPQAFTVADGPSIGDIDLNESGDNPTLRWTGRAGETFRVQLARDEAFTQIVQETELESPLWTIRGQPRGTYFVRIEARDASGLVGPLSSARRVRIGSVVQTSGGGLTSSDGALIERP